MAMSWVADENATTTASAMSIVRLYCGLHRAMPTRPMAISACDSTSQERLRPSAPIQGSRHWSSIGDQTHLNAYARLIQLAKPIVSRETPASRSQTDSVENTRTAGRPAAKPSNSRASVAGLA